MTPLTRETCSESRLRSFLDDELGEDESRKLAAHLDHCEACRDALDRLASGSRIVAELRGASPAAGPRGRVGPEAAGPTRLHRGDSPNVEELITLDFLEPSPRSGCLGRLGPYEVTRMLGRGAFGIVLKAYDPALGRYVAIKVLAPRLATSAQARTRFAREARAAAAVVHDNVVAIHAVDSWNGLPYLVMPCIAGRSLQDRVDGDGPMDVKEVLRVGMQAARALAAAHDQGLVHRDVKPSNILLESGVERVKLSDFGLARAVDDASQTQSGVVAGTPQYMSPEQARGDAIDHRSDLFSLGGVLYFMLAGHSPFRGDSTPAVLRRVCDDRPRPLRQVDPDIPGWLAKVVDRLLEKDPGRRFASAAEVAELLTHHLAEVQRTGSSATPTARRSGPITRGRASMLAAVPAALLLAAFGLPGRRDGAPQDPTKPAAAAPKAEAARPGDAVVTASSGGGPAAEIVGSGRAAEKAWEVAGFSTVAVGSTFQAVITRGDRFKVTTSSDEKLVEFLDVAREGGTLRLRLKPGRNYRYNVPLRAEISMPSLEGIAVKDASRATLNGFRNEGDFRLSVSDASRVDGSIELNRADFRLDDASRLRLAGSARAVRALAEDASRLDLSKFPIGELGIKLSDASRADLLVPSTGRFLADLSDASELAGTVNAAELGLRLADASRTHLKGKADSATIAAKDSSHLDLSGLSVGDLRVELKGPSAAVVAVHRNLEYRLEPGAKLDYTGGPASVRGTKPKSATLRSR
ncbi:Serine/threonine-protein kinase PknB [Aquisphaera giovannonii]|uniref:non-specific serine/threonine protein kinase n=1 Tax=Aquisphaera giovannonii TaxID=406548 RepID=A0A5B9VUK5_9BACT|nr:protein kinase [Aquisphaera giovannonii]QEH32176.1 Serine/threonine-protein kinase PknB [Aquisphaera giovannonii]